MRLSDHEQRQLDQQSGAELDRLAAQQRTLFEATKLAALRVHELAALIETANRRTPKAVWFDVGITSYKRLGRIYVGEWSETADRCTVAQFIAAVARSAPSDAEINATLGIDTLL